MLSAKVLRGALAQAQRMTEYKKPEPIKNVTCARKHQRALEVGHGRVIASNQVVLGAGAKKRKICATLRGDRGYT